MRNMNRIYALKIEEASRIKIAELEEREVDGE